jgi:hypothetical protein
VCKCVLYYCHRVSTQPQLTNVSYHIISYHIISRRIISYVIATVTLYSIYRSVFLMEAHCVLSELWNECLWPLSCIPIRPPITKEARVRTLCPCEIYKHVVKMGPVSLRIIRFSALSTILPVLSSIIARNIPFIGRTSGHELQTMRHRVNTGQRTVLILSFVPAISTFPCQYHSTSSLYWSPLPFLLEPASEAWEP